MSNIPIRDMTQTGTPDASSLIVFDNGTMRKGTVGSMADAVRPVASQGEAQAGADNAKTMTSLRVKESISSEIGVSVASKAQGDLANTALQPADIGATVQPHDATLDAFAGLSSSANKLPYFTGTDTLATTDLSAFGRSLIDDPDASAARTTMGVVPGTDVQAYDADLAAIAGLSSTGLIARTGAGTVSTRTITAPAAGITFSNGDGVSGNPTMALANDLAALEGLSGTSIARRTGADTWSVGTAVSNSELATMAAKSLKMNATASTSAATDTAISALTDISTPSATLDWLLIEDNATGTLKKTNASELIAAVGSGVTSLGGVSGAIALAPGLSVVSSTLVTAHDTLTADRTYYVRTNGSDSNNGLANTSGGAFLTLQKAWNTLVALDLNGFKCTIQVADGTYTAGMNCQGMPLGVTKGINNQINIIGNTTTPANCLISVTGGNCFKAGDSDGSSAMIFVDGFKMSTTTSGYCFEIHHFGFIRQGANIDFGNCANAHIWLHTGGGHCHTPPGYTISGNAGQHIIVGMGGLSIIHGTNITFLNSPVFSSFALVREGGQLIFDGNTYTNKATVTGLQYSLVAGGIILTGQTSAAYMPGATQGVTDGTGIIDCGTPWGSYSPGILSTGGTITSYTLNSAAYYIDANKTCHFRVKVTITNNGTGSGSIFVGLPTASKSGPDQIIVGRETGISGAMLTGTIGSAATVAAMQKYDNSYPGATGAVLVLSGSYEVG